MVIFLTVIFITLSLSFSPPLLVCLPYCQRHGSETRKFVRLADHYDAFGPGQRGEQSLHDFAAPFAGLLCLSQLALPAIGEFQVFPKDVNRGGDVLRFFPSVVGDPRV